MSLWTHLFLCAQAPRGREHPDAWWCRLLELAWEVTSDI